MADIKLVMMGLGRGATNRPHFSGARQASS
jgi:hypothetical protein